MKLCCHFTHKKEVRRKRIMFEYWSITKSPRPNKYNILGSVRIHNSYNAFKTWEENIEIFFFFFLYGNIGTGKCLHLQLVSHIHHISIGWLEIFYLIKKNMLKTISITMTRHINLWSYFTGNNSWKLNLIAHVSTS